MTSIVTKRFCDGVVRIASYDCEGIPIITDCNAIAQTITGFSEDELCGMKLPDLISGVTADLLREEFTSASGVSDLVDIFRRYPQACIRRKSGLETPAEIKAFIIPGEGHDKDGNPGCGIYEIIIRDKSLSSLLSQCVRQHDRAGNRTSRCRSTGLPAGDFAVSCLDAYSSYAADYGDAPFCFALASVTLRSSKNAPKWMLDREDYTNLNAALSWGMRLGLRADDVIVALTRKTLRAAGVEDMYLPERGNVFYAIGLPYCGLFQARKSLERLRDNLVMSPSVRAVVAAAGHEPALHIGCVSIETEKREQTSSLLHRAAETLFASRTLGGNRTAVYATGNDIDRFLHHEAGILPKNNQEAAAEAASRWR